VLRLGAAGAVLAAGLGPAEAARRRIDALILLARDLPTVTQRVAFISRAFIRTPYRGHTLIGGPRRPERFVVRDDCFDCVTYCETVLAAARSERLSNFEPELRRIRYRDGVVTWRTRNHYFADWSANNVADGICAHVALPGGVAIDKTLTYMRALGPHRVSFDAIPRARLLANRQRLQTGDIIGFLSRRPRLDYFHIGFVVVAPDGDLLLRHAARSHGRVLDERLAHFLAVNRVHDVTVLRPLEPVETIEV
jgi:N-acetylmuramoyl-L-alanine amidase-like